MPLPKGWTRASPPWSAASRNHSVSGFPIHALWAHPRSLSSVIERAMLERGDLRTFHEPFSYCYYVGGRREVPHLTPDPERPATWDAVIHTIQQAARDQPIFLKDMSYYFLDRLDDHEDFFGTIRKSFVVRHPARTIASYAKLQSDFSLIEVGLESQYRHLQWIFAHNPDWSPVVIDADDLQANPVGLMRRYCQRLGLEFREKALSWEPGLPPAWSDWAQWHLAVEASSGLEAQTPKPLDASLEVVMGNARFREFYEHHLPFYEKLAAYRLEPLDM